MFLNFLSSNFPHISRAHMSKGKRCFNVKSAIYYFQMKTKIFADFPFCISVPLRILRRKLCIWSHLLKKSFMENFIFCTVSFWFHTPLELLFLKLINHGLSNVRFKLFQRAKSIEKKNIQKNSFNLTLIVLIVFLLLMLTLINTETYIFSLIFDF